VPQVLNSLDVKVKQRNHNHNHKCVEVEVKYPDCGCRIWAKLDTNGKATVCEECTRCFFVVGNAKKERRNPICVEVLAMYLNCGCTVWAKLDDEGYFSLPKDCSQCPAPDVSTVTESPTVTPSAPPPPPESDAQRVMREHLLELQTRVEARQQVISAFMDQVRFLYHSQFEDVEKAARIRAVMETYQQYLSALPREVRRFLERIERDQEEVDLE